MNRIGTNHLGSPRDFSSQPKSSSRVVNVFEAGSSPIQVSAGGAQGAAPQFSAGSSTLCPVPRDPRSPQTRAALWDALNDWTVVDSADTFEHLAGGEPGVVTIAGHGRIKKRTNNTEIDFYSRLSEPAMNSVAPKFCGSHISDGNDWAHFVVLEDLTEGFSKPTVLDLQVGQQHVGSGEPGSAPALGLRINGMRQHTNVGVTHRDKAWGGQVTAEKFANELEDFLTDASLKVRAEVAVAIVDFVNQVEPWVEAQLGLRLVGTSLLIVYEGDTTVADQKAPVVKMIDFANVEVVEESSSDAGYLTGIRNLRWMLERLVAYCELQAAKEDTKSGQRELRAAQKELRDSAAKCTASMKKCQALAPAKGSNSSSIKVLHEDILKEDVASAVTQQEDNVTAAFLKSILAKHKINPGMEAFVELLEWRETPLITDRLFVTDLCNKFGLSTAATDDLLKWKGTSDTRLTQLRSIYNIKLSAAPVLPSYYDLFVAQEEVQGMLTN